MHSADCNDHKLDLVAAAGNPSTSCIAMETALFSHLSRYPPALPFNDVVVLDALHNGIVDLVAANTSWVTVLAGKGDGTFPHSINRP